MTSKERAKLKSIAANEETILQIGKNPLSDAFIKQVSDALAARELIKIRVLDTCEMLPLELAQALAEKVRCEVVQVIGSRAVLFKRRSPTDKKPSLLADTAEQKPKAAEKQNKNAPKGKREAGARQKGVNGVSKQQGKGKRTEQKPLPYKPKVGRIRSIQKNKKK